jgi:DNA invertase Pin-like site-specific DNA recombinase
VRVSTVEQAEGRHSLATQEERCRAVAAVYWPGEPVEVIRDVASARSSRRVGYRTLRGLVGAGYVGALVVASVDRICRNVGDLRLLLGELEKANVHLVAGAEGLATNTAAGRAIAMLLGVIAEWESDVISERTKRGMARVKQLGRKGPGCRPFGWAVGPDQILVKDEREQVAIDMGLSMRGKGSTWSAIASSLNEAGVKPVAAAAWSAALARVVLLAAGERRAIEAAKALDLEKGRDTCTWGALPAPSASRSLPLAGGASGGSEALPLPTSAERRRARQGSAKAAK